MVIHLNVHRHTYTWTLTLTCTSTCTSIPRGASPALSFEELSRILAEEWDSLSEVAKTPYKNKSDSQRVRYEAVSAALVLTQVDTLPRMPQMFCSVCRSRLSGLRLFSSMHVCGVNVYEAQVFFGRRFSVIL